MTVAQELVKEPCKSNPKGLKCTKKLRRVLQSEMKDIPAIKRRSAINKRLKEIKSSSTTVVRGKARRKLKRSYAGNLPQPGQVRGAVAPAANPAAPPISQPFGQLRPDFERANTDRLNAAANAGNRIQAAYYAQQLGLTPSIANNAVNPAALALFPPANNNFQPQPLAPGTGVPQIAPNLAAVNTYQQKALGQGALPPAATPTPSATPSATPTPVAQRPDEVDESKTPDIPRPTLVVPLPSGPPRGSVNTLGTGGSAPLNAQSMSGVSTVQPGEELTLINRRLEAEKKRIAFSGVPGDENDPDLLPATRTRKATQKFSPPSGAAPKKLPAKTPKTRKQVKIKPEAMALLPPGPQPKKESIGKKLKTFLGKHLSTGGSKVLPGKPLSRAQARRNAQKIRRQAFPVTKK